MTSTLETLETLIHDISVKLPKYTSLTALYKVENMDDDIDLVDDTMTMVIAGMLAVVDLSLVRQDSQAAMVKWVATIICDEVNKSYPLSKK